MIDYTSRFSHAISLAETDSKLRAIYDTLPTHEKQALESEKLSAIVAERDRAQKDIMQARNDIADADLGTLSLRLRLREYQAYVDECAPDSAVAADVTACADAYEKIMDRTEEQVWWQTLAETVPPAVLLLFLLATFGGLYCYNLRVARFYGGCADALDLRAKPFDKESFDEIVAALATD